MAANNFPPENQSITRKGITVGGCVFAPRIIPSILVLIGIIILCSLGNWQRHRAAEKQARIDTIESVRQLKPGGIFTFTELLNLWDEYQFGINDVGVKVEGQYLPTNTVLHDFRVFHHEVGYHVLNLFHTSNNQYILINRGWVPLINQRREPWPEVEIPKDTLSLTGTAYVPDPRMLTLSDDIFLQKNDTILAQKLDLTLLGERLGVQLAPFIIRLDDGQPHGFKREWLPTTAIGTSVEKHKGYALQWFTMAAALLIVFVAGNCKRIESNKEDHNS